MRIKCLIIDDEPLALDLLENFINKVPFLSLVGKCEGALSALSFFEKEEVDLLFLDINMPDINGIQLLKSLPSKPCVIFVTAHTEFALEGFAVDAIDYLLKPLPFDRFLAAVNKAADHISLKKGKSTTNKTDDYIFIKTAHIVQKIFYSDILYLEGVRDYTKIHLSDNKKPVMTLQSLKYYESRLPVDSFLRIHRSYIISLPKIDTISKKIVTINNKDLPCSENYRENLFSIIGEKL
jgi:DNA-binding LytR/AlgR family response regulator